MIRRSIFAGLFVGLLLAVAWISAANAAGSGAPAQAGPFVLNVRSQPTRDGYVEELTEDSNTGNSVDSIDSNFWLGDSLVDTQYRAVLSFNTAGLPDNATITQAQLKVKTGGGGVVLGTDPFTTLGYVIVEIRSGYFGTSAALQSGDWQAARHAAAGRIYNTPVSSWYTSNLNSASFAYINRTGTTQLRLRFQLQDDDDLTYDARSFWTGDHPTAAYRPLLVVTYTTP